MKVLMLSTDENIFKDGSEVRSRIFEYGKLVEEMHVIVKSQKSKVKNQNFGNVFLYPSNSIFGLKTYKIAKSIIRNWKPSSSSGGLEIRNCLISSQDPFETGLIGYFLKNKFNIPLHIQIHTDFLSPYFALESFKNKVRVFIAKKILPFADGIRVVSDRIKKSLITQLPNYPVNKITILPIFIDVEKIRNASVKTDLRKKYPGKFIVLIASRLTREKNIGLAIESVSALIPKFPNLLLLIVGSGPEYANLKSQTRLPDWQVSDLKLNEHVFLEGWTDDIISYYKTCDLFLLTSNYEGYGMTVVEATAAGLPVLMTDVGISIGLTTPVGDLKELVKNLDILIENSFERVKILEGQKKILISMPSKEEYLNLIKESWSRCVDIKDPRFQ